MNPNRHAYVEGLITDDHVDTLVRIAQGVLRLKIDGICGPKTRAALEQRAAEDARPDLTHAAPIQIRDGLLYGAGVRQLLSHESWYHKRDRDPRAIVAHYTATDGGAENMARRRQVKRKPGDRVANWHITVDRDGSVIQQIPLQHGGYHARGHITGIGRANDEAIGIELVGHGKVFPVAQVTTAARVWRALVTTYPILRGYAMVQHSELDPRRRSDPGPVWMARHADTVLEYAYAAATV